MEDHRTEGMCSTSLDLDPNSRLTCGEIPLVKYSSYLPSRACSLLPYLLVVCRTTWGAIAWCGEVSWGSVLWRMLRGI